MVNVKIINNNGVKLVESEPNKNKYHVDNAVCNCGEKLIVAPVIFNADHKKNDPVVVCLDHGVHAYRFSALSMGRQPI